MRLVTLCLGAALATAAVGPATAQEADSGPPPAVPGGPLLLEVGTYGVDHLSPLPAAYLDGLTLRPIGDGHALDASRAHQVRAGMRVGRRWIVQAEATWVDAEFGLANVDVPVRDVGGSVQYAFSDRFYATTGVGAVTYSPDGALANTDLRWSAGGGMWLPLAGRVSVRTELRYDMSWFSVPGVEGELQHRLGAGAGLAVSLP